MREIRIRELRYREAEALLDVELNAAFMAGERRVQVLHGIGSGALQRMTHSFVKTCGFARVAPQLIGENFGITVVDLDPPGPHAMRGYRA